VLEDDELESLSRDVDTETACRRLIDEANRRGTADNLTCAVLRMTSDTGHLPSPEGWRDRLRGFFRR